jgi:hypothetical protein
VPFDLGESFLTTAEAALGARLPDSYRKSMLCSNGGELHAAGDNWQQHPIADTSDRKRLARSANHVLRETEALRKWPGFPANALSIASNGSGDSLLFLQHGASFEPTVYAWSHETQSLSKVANDFADLTHS